MKKKILISVIAIIMIASISIMAFAGCVGKYKMKELKDFKVPKAEIGADGGELDNSAVKGGIKPINGKMSSFEMLQVGVENFYNAYYTAIEYNGGVFMTLANVLKVEQVVQSTKIRDGLGDASGKNANGATYFADNKSHSTFAKLYEKFIIRPEEWKRRTAKSGISYTKPYKDGTGRLGAFKVGSWNAPNNYKSLDELVTKNSNNPTILWMYDLKEELMTGHLEPVYDEETKTYRIALEFDPIKATKDYVKVMLVQLESNAGMPIENLEFKQLILEVVLWENGMLRSINVKEAYQMKMKLSGIGIDSVVELNALQLFSYNPNEAGYKIQEHINKF